jgi:hypothetical protein
MPPIHVAVATLGPSPNSMATYFPEAHSVAKDDHDHADAITNEADPAEGTWVSTTEEHSQSNARRYKGEYSEKQQKEPEPIKRTSVLPEIDEFLWSTKPDLGLLRLACFRLHGPI